MPNNHHLHALFSAAESANDLQTDRERARRWRLILGKEAEAQPQPQEQMVEDAGNPSDGEGESDPKDRDGGDQNDATPEIEIPGAEAFRTPGVLWAYSLRSL